ncbi:MAG: succinate dehydrogenase, hydrophobic membrane anchor protein [bacterium]|nr:succinate dehydrogenase, hydrophobic membrane anchor protein [bacterium]
MAKKQRRSPFDHTQGLGSAREGVGHWWIQRLTAVALVPLTLWFTASLIARAGDDYNAFILWLRAPFTVVLMVLLLVALFYHMALGLRVVVEDYVHTNGVKLAAIVLIYFGCFTLAVAGIIASLSVGFDGRL